MKRLVVLLVLCGLGLAQSFGIQLYSGLPFNAPTDLYIKQAGYPDTTVSNVPLASEPFQGSWYYGARVWWGSLEDRSEIELIHNKVVVRDFGIINLIAITDGFNLLFFNRTLALWHDDSLRLLARAGIGISIPHQTTVIRGQLYGEDGNPRYYGLGGVAYQLALALEGGGPDLQYFLEVKRTDSYSRITIAGGDMWGRFQATHLVVGLGWSW